MKFVHLASLIATLFLVSTASAQNPITIEQNDLIYGANIGDPADGSIEWARGPAVAGGAETVDLVWNQPFIQSVEFDNLNGISHNPRGNLLGVNYGPSDGGGAIYNLATCEGLLEGQLIGDTEGLGGDGIDLSNLGGLSVSPDNSKIALSGYDTASIIVYDYQAGNCEGTGASLSNARSVEIMSEFATQGTGWLDNDTVIGFTSNAQLVKVDVNTMQGEELAAFEDPGKSSVFTDLEYNPVISPYIYGSYGGFEDGTVNQIFVVDPRDNFSLVKTVDFSADRGDETLNTMREIAFDANGNLYASQFRGPVHLIPGAADPDTLESNSSVSWYDAFVFNSFTGIDVAVGLEISDEVAGDFNGNGQRDADDLDLLATGMMTNDLAFDLDGDGDTDIDDRRFWIEDLANTFFGDSDFNGEFNSSDFVAVFVPAKYETGQPATWTEGDWNGDKVFGSSDFVTAFQGQGYESGPREGGLQLVPEPNAVALLWMGIVCLVRRKR